jgi:site-specific recombinase XerD
MPRKVRTAPEFTLNDVLTACLLDLETRHLSPETLKMYRQIVGWFAAFQETEGRPASIAAVTADHVQAYIRHCLRENEPMTADLRFRQLRAFFNWAVKHDWIPESPMRKMDRPKAAGAPKDLFSDEDLAALVKACKGSAFEDVRDLAVLRVFMNTGARLGEVAGLQLADVDIPNRVARLTGKTGSRRVKLGPQTASALHRYILLRAHHDHAASKTLWLGQRGAMSRIGVIQIVKRRARAAGVEANPHKFRHTYATNFRMAGGSIVDLETLGGWSPNSPMTRHYGAAALAEEALQHADELGIGENV